MNKPRVINGPLYFTRNAAGAVPGIRAKLPELHRSVEFKREEIDKENRIVPVTFATEALVDRWFGSERLLCAPENCRAQRANNLGAFLSEHERGSGKQIGVIVRDSILFQNRTGKAKVRFSRSNPLAEQEWKDLEDGIRGLFSVGYVVHKLVMREESDSGEIYDATDWEILEISLVSVPADVNCVIDGRTDAAQTFPVSVTAANPHAANSFRNMIRSNRFFSPFSTRFFLDPPTGANEGGGNGGGGTPPASGNGNGNGANGGQRQRDNSGAGRGANAEITRVRELGAIGLRYNCQAEMLRLIESGGTVQAAYKYVAENNLRAAEGGAGESGNAGARGASNGGAGNPGGNNTPLLTGGGATGNGAQADRRSLGQMLVANENFTNFAKESGERKIGLDFDGFLGFGTRAILTTADIPANFIAVDRLPGIQLQGQQRLTIADLIAPGVTTSGKITYLQEVNYANAAAMVAEGGDKPEATFDLDEAEAPVRKVAVFATISDEMISDFAYIQTFVDGRLNFMIQQREEVQLLSGDGNAPNITGFLVQENVQVYAKGTDDPTETIPDAMHRAITLCRVVGFAEPTGAVLHPTDWQVVALSKDLNGQYLAGGPFFAPYGNGGYTPQARIWGLPVVVTTAMTAGTALVGDFQGQAQLFRREGIRVETSNSHGTYFKENKIAIRAEERLALCIYRPAAFVKVTGLNA